MSILYAKLGYPSLTTGCPGPDEDNKLRRIKDCEKVLDYLETHGGYVKAALLELGFPESFRLHVSAYAKTIGFDIETYRFAHRNYGHWRTLPSKAKPMHTSNYVVPQCAPNAGQCMRSLS